jgi:hypothetical protein
MNTTLPRPRHLTATISLGLALIAAPGAAQSVNPYPGMPSMQSPQSYTDFYREQLRQDYRPQASVYQYTYNRYFYHRPTLSPYLNLTRHSSSDFLNNYHRWVLPEVQRRAAASPSPLTRPQATTTASDFAVASRPMSAGHVPVQPLSNPYFNQYYNFGSPPPSKSFPQPFTPQPLPPQQWPNTALPKAFP